MRKVKTATRPLWHPLSWPSWLALALLWLIAQLPHRWALAAGGVVGPLVLRFMPRRRRIIEHNLDLCFPQWSETERASVGAESEREAGRMLISFAFAWMASPARVRRLRVEVQGLEFLNALKAQGRGVLLVGAHFSHLELAGRLLTQFVLIGGMYREHHDPAFEWAVKRARSRYAVAMFRRDELRSALRFLKGGGVLWYAPDQEYRRGDRVFAPFFGVPASTITATHQMARLTGAAVIGFAHRRLADGSYQIHLSAPLEDFPTADALIDTTRVNQLIEQAILAAPEQYLWLHARFKARPPVATGGGLGANSAEPD